MLFADSKKRHTGSQHLNKRGAGKISTRKLQHERADEGGSEGEVKRVLFSSKVTLARSCWSFLVLIFPRPRKQEMLLSDVDERVKLSIPWKDRRLPKNTSVKCIADFYSTVFVESYSGKWRKTTRNDYSFSMKLENWIEKRWTRLQAPRKLALSH